MSIKKLIGMMAANGPNPYTNAVGYWSFDEDCFDLTVHENHASLTGGSFSASGKLNYGISLSGTNQYLVVNDSPDFSFGNAGTDSPFSITMWLNPSSLSTSKWVISKRGTTNQAEYDVTLDATGRITFALYSAGSTTVYLAVRTNLGISTGSFSHITCTYSGSKTLAGLKIFVNGVSQAVTDISVGSYAGMNNGTSNLTIGQQAWNLSGTSGFAGVIDEVGFYNTELSQATIDLIYNGGAGRAITQSIIVTTTLQYLAKRDNYILASDGTNLKFSSNNGSSWTDYNWGVQWSGGAVYNKTVDMAYIFSDGTLIFACTNKVYRSSDGLVSINEVTPKLADGVTNYPVHTPAVASFPGNYYQLFGYDAYYYADDIFVWINYCNVVSQNMGVAPVTVWYTTDKGATIKSAYRLGQHPSYKDNGTAGGGGTGTTLGDSGNSIIARHGHNVARNPGTYDWYSCTGDAVNEVHWFKHTYNPGTDTWTTTRIVASAAENTRWKAVGFQIIGAEIYWMSDATGSVAASERGIFKANIADIEASGSSAANTRVVDTGAFAGFDLKISGTGKLIATFAEGNPRGGQLLVADNYGSSNLRYVNIRGGGIAGIGGFVGKITPIDQNGFWKITVGDFWTQPVKTVLLKSNP